MCDREQKPLDEARIGHAMVEDNIAKSISSTNEI